VITETPSIVHFDRLFCSCHSGKGLLAAIDGAGDAFNQFCETVIHAGKRASGVILELDMHLSPHTRRPSFIPRTNHHCDRLNTPFPGAEGGPEGIDWSPQYQNVQIPHAHVCEGSPGFENYPVAVEISTSSLGESIQSGELKASQEQSKDGDEHARLVSPPLQELSGLVSDPFAHLAFPMSEGEAASGNDSNGCSSSEPTSSFALHQDHLVEISGSASNSSACRCTHVRISPPGGTCNDTGTAELHNENHILHAKNMLLEDEAANLKAEVQTLQMLLKEQQGRSQP
jgi:hypothetical protein